MELTDQKMHDAVSRLLDLLPLGATVYSLYRGPARRRGIRRYYDFYVVGPGWKEIERITSLMIRSGLGAWNSRYECLQTNNAPDDLVEALSRLLYGSGGLLNHRRL